MEGNHKTLAANLRHIIYTVSTLGLEILPYGPFRSHNFC